MKKSKLKILGPMKQIKIISALFLFSFGLNAQLKSYEYFRELKPVTETGYYQIKIGSAILDREGYHRVYEITEKDTLEVAYVTEQYDWNFHDRSFFKDLKIIDKSYEQGKYSYVTLVLDTNIIYTTLYLNFGASEFFKDITLEGSQDNKSWKTITENEKMFRYYPANDRGYFRNKIDFNPISFKYVRVKIDDTESTRMDLVSAAVSLVKEEVIEEGELVESLQNRSEDKKNKQTIVECQFPRAFAITDLQVNIENENPYHRQVFVEVFNPINGKDKWITFGSGILSTGSSNKIYLNNIVREDFQFKSGRIRLLIQNNDDQPLGKISIKPYTHLEKISLKLQKNKKYVVAYGKTKDEEPTYDLAHFKNVIALLSSVELGNEIKIPHVVAPVQKPLIGNKMWIWVALIVCVLVIGLFTFKLMKSDNKQS